MKHVRSLLYPPRSKAQDAGSPQFRSSLTPPILASMRATVMPASDVSDLSNAPTPGSKTLQHASTMAHFVHDNALAIVSRMPQKRKLLRQMSSSGAALFSAPRRGRRNDLAPTVQQEKPHYSQWVIMPRSTWKVRWDLWIGFIISYSVILIPYRIGFGIEIAGWEQKMNYFFDSSFAMDVVLNFFTGYYDEDVFVHELPKIRHRYVRSWFLFDMASTIPFDQFLQVVTTASSSLLTLKLIRVFRLFRLLKLMRLLRLKRAVQAVQMDALNAHVLQTFKSLLTIIFIIHLISCGWYMFYTWDPTGLNWVTNMNPDGFKSPYLVSFYWVSNTMMSVGYGDIYGITDSERLYATFVACLGSICVGMIIANIQMLTENYNPRGIKLRQKLQDTKEFLMKRNIPRRLRQRVISQFEFHWSHRTVFDEDRLLRQFPRSLQYEILAASMEAFVKKFPFFGMTTVEFFVYAIPRLRPIVLAPGQVLVDAESVWEELYFITAGTVESVQSNLVVGSLASGEICGIEYLVNARRRYTRTYRSISKTELYAMHSHDLLKAIEKCPVAHKYLEDLAVILSERYEESARRGKRALDRQRSIRAVRRASLSKGEPFLHKRHRKSSISGNINTMASDFVSRMDLSISADEVKTHWSVVRHYSRPRIVWDVIIGVVVSITAVAVPFRIAFDVSDTVFLYVTDRASDILFVLDVIFSFCTTYVDDTGVEIIDRHEIRRHYLRTTFLVDVLATIPFDFVVEAVTVGNIFRSLKLIRTVKLVKLLRLIRLSKLFKMNSQWMSELDISIDTVRLLKLLAPVLIIAHYVGCFWFYMSADRPADDAWWGHIFFEDRSSKVSKYVASVYWAITTMTTVGFGDVYAVNDSEKIYSIVVVIGGTTLFAYVVGTVIEVASNSKSLMNQEHEMVQKVNAYIKERGVSTEFMVACQEHLRFLEGEKTLFQEHLLFDALSYSLRSELILILNGGVISKIRFFDKKPKWFLTLVLPRLVPQFFLEGDILIYQDNPVSGIFFIMSGSVIAKTRHYSESHKIFSAATRTQGRANSDPIVADRDGIIAKIYEGEFFGYKETLTESVAQYNVFAMRPTGTYLLPREFLEDFEEQYSQVADEIRALIMQSITKQQKVISGWQNNEAVGLTSNDRERVTQLSIARRSDDDGELNALKRSSFRPHPSFNPSLSESDQRGSATGASSPNLFADRKGPTSLPNPEESAKLPVECQEPTNVEPLQQDANAELVTSIVGADVVSYEDRGLAQFPGVVPPLLLPSGASGKGLELVDVTPTPSARRTQRKMLPVPSYALQRPNNATTLSAVHPSIEAVLDRGSFCPTRRSDSGVSARDVSGKSARRPSERYSAMRKGEVAALVDQLLNEEGFEIERTPSGGRQQKPTMTL